MQSVRHPATLYGGSFIYVKCLGCSGWANNISCEIIYIFSEVITKIYRATRKRKPSGSLKSLSDDRESA